MSRHFQLGQAYVEHGRFAEAAREFAKAAGSPREDQAAALASLALAELNLKQTKSARANLLRAEAIDPSHPVVLCAKATLALDARRFDEGRKALRRLLEKFPGDAEVLGMCAFFEQCAGRPDAALVFAERGLARDPTYVQCLEVSLISSFCLGRDADAEAAASRLAAVDPLNPYLPSCRATTALSCGRPEEARRHALEALRLQPDEENAHAVLLRLRATDHPFFRFLEGRIGSRRVPLGVRIAGLFVPWVFVILWQFMQAPGPTAEWPNRLFSPVALLALWLAGLTGWHGWWISSRSLTDRNARRVFALRRAEFLMPAIFSGVIVVAVSAWGAFDVAVAGIVFLSFFLLSTWLFGSQRWPLRARFLLGLHIAALGVGLIAQVALNMGENWAAPMLWTLNLAGLSAMLFLTPKETAAPPPLPISSRPSHVPPPLPR